MPHRLKPHKQRRKISAFTLIEMLIVIAIIVVLGAILLVAAMAVIGETNEEKTKAALQAFGDNGMNSLKINGGISNLIKPERIAAKLSKDFRTKAGIRKNVDFKSLNEKQRSMLLALLIAPTKDQWDKIVVGDKSWKYDPTMREEAAKEYIATDSDGFNYAADAWGNPITFELKQSIGAGTDIKWTLRSAGEDGEWGNADDLNYSEIDKHSEGAYTP